MFDAVGIFRYIKVRAIDLVSQLAMII